MLTLLWNFPFHYFVSLLIFIAASITDYLDGKIARARGLVTDFGKFLDPIADKMLTTAAFLGFIALTLGNFSENTVVQTIESPNGEYYAQVIDSAHQTIGRCGGQIGRVSD